MIIDLILDRKENEPLLALGHTHMVLVEDSKLMQEEKENGMYFITK